ncbi:MAG: hypothetical protein ACODAG_04730 [Myxococcota bacterium]
MTVAQRLGTAAYVFRQELRSVVTSFPAIYLPLARMQRETGSQAVGAHTDIVIEGFPRSGNSFVVDAFLSAQRRPVTVAHHLHAAAQIVEGARRRLPTLVLIREPEEAVVSFKALQLQASRRDRGHPIATSLRLLFRSYARFYRRVWPCRDQVVIAPFNDVIRDLGAVIQRVNTRFGTDFVPFEHTEANVQALRSGQRYHAAPSEERHRLKGPLLRELEQARHCREACAARAIHAKLSSHAFRAF